MKSQWRQLWLVPLQSSKRRYLFAAQLLGSLAGGFMAVFMTLDILRYGEAATISYNIIRFGITGCLVFPLLTMCYLLWNRHVFTAVAIMGQLLALMPLAFPVLMHNPDWIALFWGVSNGVYWQAFHLAMTAHTSDAGRGHEVTLSQIVTTGGGIIGVLLGGVAAAAELPMSIAIYPSLFQLGATIMFCRLLPRCRAGQSGAVEGEIASTKLWHELRGQSGRTQLTIMECIYSFMADILRPAWLKFLGITAMSVGVFSALIIIMQVAIAPLAGKLENGGKRAEIRYGGMLVAAGWLPWLFSTASGLLFLAIPLWSAGVTLMQTGMGSMWYRQRSAMAILAREMLYTAVRIVAALVVIPLLFHHSQSYAFAVFAVSIALVILAKCPKQ